MLPMLCSPTALLTFRLLFLSYGRGSDHTTHRPVHDLQNGQQGSCIGMPAMLLLHVHLQLLGGEAHLVAEGTLVTLRGLPVNQLLAAEEELEEGTIVNGLHGVIVLVLVSGTVAPLVEAVAAVDDL